MKSMLTKTARLAALAAITLAFSACSMFQSAPRPDHQRLTMEKQIAEANKKIDDISHRVSVLEFMVDNHQRAIDDLKRNLKAARKNPVAKPLQESKLMEKPVAAPTGAAASAPAPPLPRTSEKKTPPAKSPVQSLAKSPAKGPVQSSAKSPAKGPAKGPVQSLAKSPAKSPVQSSAKSPGGAEKIYHQAMAAFNARDYNRALALFTTVAKIYPRHPLAENAVYWSGECHYGKKEFTKAIETFQSLIKRYPKGWKAPGALLKIGYAYLELKNVAQGKAYLKRVITEFPFSPEATKAEAKLKTLM